MNGREGGVKGREGQDMMVMRKGVKRGKILELTCRLLRWEGGGREDGQDGTVGADERRKKGGMEGR